MSTTNGRALRVSALILAPFLGACHAPDDSGPAGAAIVEASPSPAAARSALSAFRAQEKDGLTFKVENVSASVQLYAGGRRARPNVQRELSLRGNVSDRSGRRLFRIADVALDEMTDGSGHSLLEQVDLDEQQWDQGGWSALRENRNPGSPVQVGFGIQARDLEALPVKLGRVRGHADVEIVTDLASADVVREASDTFVTVVPGFSYRLTRYEEENDRVRFELEYRLEHAPGDGPTPSFGGIDLRDRNGNRLYSGLRPAETVLGNVTVGLVQAEIGVQRQQLQTMKLYAVMGARPIRFDFDLADIPITEGRRAGPY